MIRINNVLLPAPAELKWDPAPAPAAVTAAWAGLTPGEMAGILTPAAGPCTLSCLDPVSGENRGFPALLRTAKARALGQGLYALSVTFEETV